MPKYSRRSHRSRRHGRKRTHRMRGGGLLSGLKQAVGIVTVPDFAKPSTTFNENKKPIVVGATVQCINRSTGGRDTFDVKQISQDSYGIKTVAGTGTDALGGVKELSYPANSCQVKKYPAAPVMGGKRTRSRRHRRGHRKSHTRRH